MRNTLFRYRSNSEFTIDEIKNNYIYFSSPKNLNDPFDACSSLFHFTKNKKDLDKIIEIISKNLKINRKDRREYCQKLKKNPNLAYSQFNEYLKEFVENHGVACFTLSPANILLWANYTNNHKGLMMQFDPFLDNKIFDHSLDKIDYVKDFQSTVINPIADDLSLKNIFYKKHEFWKGEQEIRIIKEKNGKHKFDINCLKSISFGLRVEDEFKYKILSIIEKKYPEVECYQTKVVENEYALDFFKYEKE